MAKLTDEEKGLLASLTEKAKQAETEEDDSEVEWWEEDKDGNRRGGRVPWSKGKAIYGKHFPDLFGEKPPEKEKGSNEKGSGGGGSEKQEKGVAGKYFGNKD